MPHVLDWLKLFLNPICFIISVLSLFKRNVFLGQEMKLGPQFIAWKRNSFPSIFHVHIDLRVFCFASLSSVAFYQVNKYNIAA